MNRSEVIEKQIKRRYNRDVEVYRKVHLEDKEPIKTDIKIVFKDKEFYLTEYLKDGLTVCSTLEHDKKQWKYDTHLKAEVHCMDLIGGYNGDLE